MEINNTSYTSNILIKLKSLYTKYINKEDKEARILKYYQYFAFNYLTNPDFNTNARGILLYHPMGTGKTSIISAIALKMYKKRQVVIFTSKALQKNAEDSTKKIARLLNQNDITKSFKYVTMNAQNAALQMEKKVGTLDNKLLIVDEAHNFFRAIVNSSSDSSNAMRIFQMIQNAYNLKIIFMTGTPIIKNIFELVPCINMLTGKDTLPTQYENFMELFINKDNDIINEGKLMNRIMGLVSYTPAIQTDMPEKLPTIIENIEMSEYQYPVYLSTKDREETSSGKGFMRLSSRAMVLPSSESDSYHSYFAKSRMLSNFCQNSSDPSIYNETTSPKAMAIVANIIANKGIDMVYSDFIQNGLMIVVEILKNNGYILYTDSNDSKYDFKRYALITGDVSDQARVNILTYARHIDNLYGKKIKIILFSKSGTTGLSFKYIRRIHKMEPAWDKTIEDQIDARGVRVFSHKALPLDEQNVQPYLYISIPNIKLRNEMPLENQEEKSIDQIFHERACVRYGPIVKSRKILINVSFECQFNKLEGCRQCKPTNQQLYTSTAQEDILMADPCEPYEETSIEAEKIVYNGDDYYYIKDHSQPMGYQIFAYDKSLAAYKKLPISIPDVPKIIHQISQL